MAQRTCTIERWHAEVERFGNGEIVIPSTVWHPERGRVECRGAELLGGMFHRSKRAIRYSPVPLKLAPPAKATPKGRETDEVWLLSYLDHSGRAVGMAGAVTAGTDSGLLRRLLEAWKAVIRTRRLVLADTRPLCPGALRTRWALRSALAEEDGDVFVLQGNVPNLTELEEVGARSPLIVATPDQVPSGAVVMVGAAGAPPATHRVLAARGARVLDTTCPLVAAAQGEVRRFADQGESVVVIGRQGQAVVPGLLGQAPEAVQLVQDLSGVPAVRVADPARVAVVLAPGVGISGSQQVAEAVRTRFGHVLPQHPATYCHYADDRRHSLARLAASCDLVLTAGRDTTGMLTALGASGVRAYPVASVEDLRPHWFPGTATVGVVEAPGATPALMAGLVRALQSLGPFVVEHQQTSTRSTAADLPLRDRVGEPLYAPVTLHPTRLVASHLGPA